MVASSEPQQGRVAPPSPGTETVAARRSDLKKKTAVRYPFWFGGSSSSMAACVTHPLDLIKVRLQMRTADAPKSMSGTFVHILKNDGPRGLYSGISASLLRQITYSTVRFGVYEELKTRATARLDRSSSSSGKKKKQQPPFPALVAMAAVSGFLGGVSGNAADVLNVRMQHDAALPPHSRRNYRNALHGWIRMTQEEGLRSWFRGWWPNSVRAAAMTASQLASYDTAKSILVDKVGMRGDGMGTHFTASVLAGVVAATVTNPVDVIKTRVMSSGGSHGVLGVVRDLYHAEGVRWMFRGWTPSFLRLGPQTICTFIFLETHRKMYRKVNSIDEGDDLKN